jgi:hypothetical protein
MISVEIVSFKSFESAIFLHLDRLIGSVDLDEYPTTYRFRSKACIMEG